MRVHQQQLLFKGIRVNTIYFNDSHGQTKYIDAFCDEQDKFFKEHKDNINLTLSGGDVFLDKNKKNDIVAERVLSRVDAIGIGNHDIESGDYFADLLKKFNLKDKFLSANMKYNDSTSLKNDIPKSVMLKKRDEKIGVIGVSPLDFNSIAFLSNQSDILQVESFEDTISSVKEEVEKLENNGINKIFLLAHTGERSKLGIKYYEELSKIGGIDVIIGGHDHREINRWFVSDRNEPVRVVATGESSSHNFGENLDYIGKLELDFDDKGVLNPINCKNEFIKLTKKPVSVNENVVRVISEPTKLGDVLKGHSEIGNMIADSNLWFVNKHTNGQKADFAFVNAGTIRGNFDDVNVTEDDIKSTVPFISSKLIKADLTKKQIKETLSWCAKSTGFTKVAPGIMHVSGMDYKVNSDLSVSDIHILNNDGSIKCKLDECPDDKKFSVVFDLFLASGPLGLDALKKDYKNDKNVELFEASRQDALLEYLQEVPVLNDYKKQRIKKNV